MKVLYSVGPEIGSETVMKKGIIREDFRPLRLEGETAISFDDVRQVELVKLSGLGTIIKVQNGSDTLYLTVPRLYFNVGTGFVIVNYFATKKLKKVFDTVVNQTSVV